MMEKLFAELRENRLLRLKVKIQTKSAQNVISEEMTNGTIKIKIAAVRDKDKANKELVVFLSETFKVPKKNVLILSGRHSPIKIIEIRS